MIETFSVTYAKCGFCTARNHCDACGAEIARALSEKAGIVSASAGKKPKTLQISYTTGRDTLEDILDGMGVMMN
ncbi:MAG: hypothetical protein K2O18_15355 [Oscillospiraceae bacterium]|nr:hypothetical protein [Oscillospiraceae bacterium]